MLHLYSTIRRVCSTMVFKFTLVLHHCYADDRCVEQTAAQTIGKGNFAKVKLARHVLTGVEVAIKIIDKTTLNETSLEKLMREVQIMKRLDHPNIVKLYEVINTDETLFLVS